MNIWAALSRKPSPDRSRGHGTIAHKSLWPRGSCFLSPTPKACVTSLKRNGHGASGWPNGIAGDRQAQLLHGSLLSLSLFLSLSLSVCLGLPKNSNNKTRNS